MGVYTYGEFSATFSRELTPDEVSAFEARFAALSTYPETGQRDVFGDDWVLNDDKSWGDVGRAWLDKTGLELRAEGKVYEIPQCLGALVSWLPDDVEVTGDGQFESEGYNWGLRVEGRTVQEYDVFEIDDREQARFEALEAFAKSVAACTKDGELLDGEEFVLENDDAVSTLHAFIDQARALSS